MSNTEFKIEQDKTFSIITSAVNKMVDFIRPTYGPAGNKVIIDKPIYKMIVDDGVQIARDFELSDPAENAVVKVIRETAIRTNDRVGDGTTSSLIMLQAIVNEINRSGKKDGRKIEIELKKGLEEVQEQLKKTTKQIKTKEDLKKVALISFDNEKVAEMIADLYFKLGVDATITIDKSPTMETSVELSDGVKISNGYLSQYMITNPERMESVLEKPYILITDYRLTEHGDILPIMEKMVKEGKHELVIICENMEGSALATAIVNRAQGKFCVVAVVAPQVADRKVFLEDIALLTGAKMFTESKGDKLENAEIKDLGRAARFVCRREESVIVGPRGKKAEVMSATAMLKAAYKAETKESQKKDILARIGLYTNTIAVIKVGAPTENEQKALKYKVEDAVNATKVAFQHGVVAGGGMALARVKTSSSILNEALQAPARQVFRNMGGDTISEYIDRNDSWNLVTGEQGNFMDVGVADPVDVLLAGVESAVSIASLLVTTSGMIVETQKQTS